MRSRSTTHDQLAEVARRRLELLSAELAGIRPGPDADTGNPDVRGPGELSVRSGGGPPPSPEQPPRPPPEPPESCRPPASPGPARPPVDDREPVAPAPGRHAHRSVGLLGLVAGWTHDRLPATLQGRVRLSATHLVVLALLVTAALALTGWWVVHAGDRGSFVAPVSSTPQPLVSSMRISAPPSPGGPSPPGTVPAAAGASSPAATIVVDVAGKVRRPGIATLPSGSRVVDAIRAAGGARRGVRLGSLNLARVLTDGEQVVVGLPPPAGVAASVDSSATVGPTTPMVNINSASQAELEELPGVGPVTAQAILTYRSENGAFTAVDQLLDVSGIGDATLAKIAPFVTL